MDNITKCSYVFSFIVLCGSWKGSREVASEESSRSIGPKAGVHQLRLDLSATIIPPVTACMNTCHCLFKLSDRRLRELCIWVQVATSTSTPSPCSFFVSFYVAVASQRLEHLWPWSIGSIGSSGLNRGGVSSTEILSPIWKLKFFELLLK